MGTQNTGSHRRAAERIEDSQRATAKRIQGDSPVCPRCGGMLYKGWCEQHGKAEDVPS